MLTKPGSWPRPQPMFKRSGRSAVAGASDVIAVLQLLIPGRVVFMGRARTGEPMAYLLATLATMPDCTAGRWPYSQSGGYGNVRVDGPTRPTATVVCEWYHGPRPAGLQVCHSCGKGDLG